MIAAHHSVAVSSGLSLPPNLSINDAFQAEVKEASKPNPFTAQVAEPGEEERRHDRCEGRPTALLSLHTQHASLAPLQAALDIWDTFISQVR